MGWDWGSQRHAVTVLDETGATTQRWNLSHTEDGITTTLRRLASYGDPTQAPVAIETSKGLVVDRRLAAGHPVVAIHPGTFTAMRPRWGASRAKSDAFDSFMLADLLRSGAPHLRFLTPPRRIRWRSKPCHASAATSSPPASAPSTSCGPCWRRTGLALLVCSLTWTPTSRCRSWNASPARNRPPS
ncbi:transposase [Nonomuraea sp. K274]|uniref:Transposase n=1 Tax=Nonomuraea cypriaca TaxID=1187855 RepID=A0A931A8D6_9ACTN|nr:transposase [Nonomuraea cypriaca]